MRSHTFLSSPSYIDNRRDAACGLLAFSHLLSKLHHIYRNHHPPNQRRCAGILRSLLVSYNLFLRFAKGTKEVVPEVLGRFEFVPPVLHVFQKTIPRSHSSFFWFLSPVASISDTENCRAIYTTTPPHCKTTENTTLPKQLVRQRFIQQLRNNQSKLKATDLDKLESQSSHI